MRFILLLSIIITNQYLSAQKSNLIIKGTHPFRISINNLLIHTNYINEIKIKQLYGEQHYNVKVEFENDTTVLKKNVYIIDDNLTYHFKINLLDFKLKQIIPNPFPEKEDEQIIVSYTGERIKNAPTTDNNTIAKKDTTYTPPFNGYYELEGYKGIITCPWPIKPEELVKLKGIINSPSIDDDKFEKVKEHILYSDSMCIMVDQVVELIPLFQYEDTKLVFAKFILPSIFDIDNIGKLETVFEFENSVNELKEMVK